MSRQPWSIPKGHELWHVALGIVFGVVITYLLMLARGDLVGIILFLGLMLLPALWMLSNAVGYFHEQDVESKQRQRELEDTRQRADADLWWLRTANRAATNKHTGLAWTGRGRSRGVGR